MSEDLKIEDLTQEEAAQVRAAHTDAMEAVKSQRQAAAQAGLQEAYDAEVAKIQKMNITGLRRVHFIAQLNRKYRKLGLEVW